MNRRRGPAHHRSVLPPQPPGRDLPPLTPPIRQDTYGQDGTAPQQENGQDRLLPAAEVAVIMSCTLRTLNNWERAGLLRPVRIRGRRLYRLSDLDALMSDAP